MHEQGYTRFDRVVIFRLKRLHRHPAVLGSILGQIILERDACQNYMAESKSFGAYSRIYGQMPGLRVLVSCAAVALRLHAEGVSALFVAMGYDEQMLSGLDRPRDIEAALSLRARTMHIVRGVRSSVGAVIQLKQFIQREVLPILPRQVIAQMVEVASNLPAVERGMFELQIENVD